MRRSLLAFLAAAAAFSAGARADQVITFESLGLPPNSYENNAGTSGLFNIDGAQFNNSYDSTYGVWSGWAFSTTTDTTDPSYTNQYSAITGSGAGGSQTYAVAYTFGANSNAFNPAGSYIHLPSGTSPVSMEVTNTTYAYDAMLDGNQFSTKFGPGSYFLLDVRGYTGTDGTGKLVGTVNFYLADFLGSNAYIVNTWQTLNLGSLADAASLVFGLSSSDNDPVYGMNTPAYFAMDNLTLGTSAVPEPGAMLLMVSGLAGLAVLNRMGSRSASRCPAGRR